MLHQMQRMMRKMLRLILSVKTEQAIESIKQANTNAEVDQATTVAENNIDAVQVDVVKKQAARDKITAEVAKRIEAVKQTPNATDEEKQAAVNQISSTKIKHLIKLIKNQTNDQSERNYKSSDKCYR